MMHPLRLGQRLLHVRIGDFGIGQSDGNLITEQRGDFFERHIGRSGEFEVEDYHEDGVGEDEDQEVFPADGFDGDGRDLYSTYFRSTIKGSKKPRPGASFSTLP